MTYPSPTTVNGSEFVSILNYINIVTNYWISKMLMIAIFVLFTMGYLRSKPDDDFVGAIAIGSYATFVTGLMFFLIGFIDPLTFGVIIGITIISSAVLFLDKRG